MLNTSNFKKFSLWNISNIQRREIRYNELSYTYHLPSHFIDPFPHFTLKCLAEGNMDPEYLSNLILQDLRFSEE